MLEEVMEIAEERPHVLPRVISRGSLQVFGLPPDSGFRPSFTLQDPPTSEADAENYQAEDDAALNSSSSSQEEVNDSVEGSDNESCLEKEVCSIDSKDSEDESDFSSQTSSSSEDESSEDSSTSQGSSSDCEDSSNDLSNHHHSNVQLRNLRDSNHRPLTPRDNLAERVRTDDHQRHVVRGLVALRSWLKDLIVALYHAIAADRRRWHRERRREANREMDRIRSLSNTVRDRMDEQVRNIPLAFLERFGLENYQEIILTPEDLYLPRDI